MALVEFLSSSQLSFGDFLVVTSEFIVEARTFHINADKGDPVNVVIEIREEVYGF